MDTSAGKLAYAGGFCFIEALQCFTVKLHLSVATGNRRTSLYKHMLYLNSPGIHVAYCKYFKIAYVAALHPDCYSEPVVFKREGEGV